VPENKKQRQLKVIGLLDKAQMTDHNLGSGQRKTKTHDGLKRG
jgi:hypothetical protein